MSFLSLLIPFYLLIGAITLLVLWWRKRLNYWADRGIVHEKPAFFVGNLSKVGKTKTLRDPFKQLYEKYKHVVPFAGFYLSIRIAAIIFDLDLIQRILVKDFNNFSDRDNYYNVKDDPLSGNVATIDGASWRNIRNKLTPTFTASKMKFMFPLLVEVANEFVKVLRKESEQLKVEGSMDTKSSEGIEIKDVLARFTTDVVGTCAFGLECNSLQDPDTKFRKMGSKVFNEFHHGRLAYTFAQGFPKLARKLGIKMTAPDVSEFFLKLVYDTVAYREKTGIVRNDFMNLLLELKNQEDGLTIDQIAAQAFVFFVAGFESSSSTMSFALYELALNQDIQARARDEIETVLARFNGELTYETLREMHYLDKIISETLRKYSIATVVLRKTLNDYPLPNSKYVLEKGILVGIPVDAIHRDPEIYPDPERFDPSRFDPEAVAKRHPMAYLPFGEGPRNCIGMRFGKMQVQVGLASLLRNFKFTLAPHTKIPLEFKKTSFLLSSKSGIHLNLEPIGDSK